MTKIRNVQAKGTNVLKDSDYEALRVAMVEPFLALLRDHIHVSQDEFGTYRCSVGPEKEIAFSFNPQIFTGDAEFPSEADEGTQMELDLDNEVKA